MRYFPAQHGVRVFLFTLLVFVSGCSGARSDDSVTIYDQAYVQLQDEPDLLVFNIETAISAKEKQRGLQNRTHLDENAGMLFLFGPKPQMLSFWMRDTLIPLDILFLDIDGTIHHIHHMAKPLDETKISSERPSYAVLEINGGFSEALGIKVGDKILHPAFRNMLAQ